MSKDLIFQREHFLRSKLELPLMTLMLLIRLEKVVLVLYTRYFAKDLNYPVWGILCPLLSLFFVTTM
jgi:hypothetical protein